LVTRSVLAVDVGGTKLSAALVTPELEVLHPEEVRTPRSDAGCDPGLAELASLVERLRHVAADRGVGVEGIGLGFPEYTIDDRLTSREVFAWDVQPAVLFGGAGVPVAVEADVRCAARAEAVTRQVTGTLLYVSWGTGISSTLVVDGRCLLGRRGEALALGEFDVPTVVDAEWIGNLESFASGRGVERRFSGARGGASSGDDLDCHAITALAADGQPAALGVIGSAASAMARALHECVALLDPDLVVLGGGIGSSDSLLPRLATEELAVLQTRPDPVSVVPARLGARAGLLGAALVAWERVG
jgi:glucokinase